MGHLDGTLSATPFDPISASISGDFATVFENLSETTHGAPEVAASRTGTLFALTGGGDQNLIALVDRGGGERVLLDVPRDYKDPRFSPDGRQIAYEIKNDNVGDIWILDTESGSQTRLTLEEDYEDLYPVWSPDGNSIAFTSRRAGTAGLWIKSVGGGGQARSILSGGEIRFPGSFTPDGSSLFYREISPNTGFDIYSIAMEGNEEPIPVRVTQFGESSPAISPSGRWLAYVSDESGRNEIYVQRYPEAGARWAISAGPGTEPVWGPDERELFYRDGNSFMAAQLTLGQTVTVTSREEMFTGQYKSNVRWPEWDIHPSGEYFVVIPEGETSKQPIVIVNWVGTLE